MDMEFNGEFSDHSVIVKRKRSKRQRPSSPFCAAAVTSSSSSGGALGGSGGGGGGRSFNDFSIRSPSISTDDAPLTTEEEEDMAKCLIMLARSNSPAELRKPDHQNTDKQSSRRFIEMATATTAAGRSGYDVYECKTCNRTFPSFQALGGHRASHKKPKSVPEEIERKLALSPPPLIKKEFEETNINKSIENFPLPPLSLQISGNGKAKVHECSICGAEFLSGQALGGHMRRHRTTTSSTTVTTTYSPPLMSSQTITNINATTDIGENPAGSNRLLFDLNLPAPADDLMDSKFPFSASTSQNLVFSAPALVNCHY